MARFLYFSSNLANDLIGFQVFPATLNYLHCFLSTKFFALLGDVGFALLAYTNIAAAPIAILSYTMAPGGAFYYFIAQAYGVVSVVPYAFIAQLYWLMSMFAVYAGYFSLVGVFAFFTSPHILFELAALVLFILNFAFDLANLFTFAAVNSLIVFSENQITPFLGIVGWVSGNLASTLPNAFYVYYLAAMLLFSSGFVIVNRFLVDRIKGAQTKLNPLADSKQVVVVITHFSGASSVFVGTAGRLVTNLINLKPCYYNFPERRFSS